MRSQETSLGGPARELPKTAGDLIQNALSPSGELRQPALEKLCSLYWKPIYWHIRLAWGKSNEDAKDLSQAFLLWLIEGEALARYRTDRGSFRAYLKTLLRNFVHNQEEALRRLKRGGGVRLVGLSQEDGAPRDIFADSRAVSPEEVFDKAWKVELVKGAVERALEGFRSKGQGRWVQVFEEYGGAGAGTKPTYAELARRLGLKESDIGNYLLAVRKAIRTEIRAALSRITSNPSELEEEWNALLRL